MAQLVRDDHGVWRLEGASRDEAASEHGRCQHRYMTALDPVFTQAEIRSEFDFLHALIPVFGLQSAGWDPYETTIRAVRGTLEMIDEASDFEKARHLQLWLWGHIVEASAPYELLARLLAVCAGQRPRMTHFPDSARGVPQSPWKKVKALEAQADALGLSDVLVPVREIWDGQLRNAVFHADYTLYGRSVRLPRVGAEYTHEEIERLVVRALCFHRALEMFRTGSLAQYTEPKVISAGAFAPGELATVIVREGYGAVGVKDAHSPEAVARGAIPFRMGIFTDAERAMLDADPQLARLPSR
jgi:hypothetical protein